ncbi:MAG: glycosyltransferase family 9 protein [Actinomycetes bacterium]
MTRVLAVRLDSDGDVLLTGPAVGALRRDADAVDLLVSPAGRAAAELLPGVDDVLVLEAPWSGYRPPPVDRRTVEALVDDVRRRGYDEAVVFTSFHQSALPTALLLRLAGVPRIAAASEDYPGSLLDVRHRRMPGGAPDDGGPAGGHEVTAALALVAAAGHPVPAPERARLAVRRPLPDVDRLVPTERYVVVHPGASVPARALTAAHARSLVAGLVEAGHRVVVTGGPGERDAAAEAAGDDATSTAGRTSLAELAAVLERADAVVVPNTGPAHLAAAVGTPVVSLFAPVVPAERWAPWGVPHVLLGDQDAPCAGSRARECPVPGHPCLSEVSPAEVVRAVQSLVGAREAVPL